MQSFINSVVPWLLGIVTLATGYLFRQALSLSRWMTSTDKDVKRNTRQIDDISRRASDIARTMATSQVQNGHRDKTLDRVEVLQQDNRERLIRLETALAALSKQIEDHCKQQNGGLKLMEQQLVNLQCMSHDPRKTSDG